LKKSKIETFELNGRRLNVSVKISERARKTIRVGFKTGELVVTLPIGRGVDVESFLKKHSRELSRKYETWLSKKRIIQDDVILVKGKPYHVKVEKIKPPSKIPVVLEDESIFIYPVGRKNPVSLLKQWLIEQTRELVREVVEKYSNSLDVNPGKVSVRDTSKWGYCKKNGEIVYNWQIMGLPPRLAEYIILHEMVHLTEFNHQKGFYSELGNILPDYKQRQKDIKHFSLVDSISDLSI
jgi:predicted metal-dependent hydrolase